MKRNCILNIILIFFKWPLLPLLKNCTNYWFIPGKKRLFYSQADSLSGLKYISRVMHRPIQVIKLEDYHEILILLIWLHELSSLLMELLYTCMSLFLNWEKNLIDEILPINSFLWMRKKKKAHHFLTAFKHRGLLLHRVRIWEQSIRILSSSVLFLQK